MKAKVIIAIGATLVGAGLAICMYVWWPVIWPFIRTFGTIALGLAALQVIRKRFDLPGRVIFSLLCLILAIVATESLIGDVGYVLTFGSAMLFVLILVAFPIKEWADKRRSSRTAGMPADSPGYTAGSTEGYTSRREKKKQDEDYDRITVARRIPGILLNTIILLFVLGGLYLIWQRNVAYVMLGCTDDSEYCWVLNGNARTTGEAVKPPTTGGVTVSTGVTDISKSPKTEEKLEVLKGLKKKTEARPSPGHKADETETKPPEKKKSDDWWKFGQPGRPEPVQQPKS